MNDEFAALIRNDTWSFLSLHPSKNMVGCKWVYRVKYNADGSVECYKARVVTKDFHQIPGLDYYVTFSLVIKPNTLRIILSLFLS